MSSTLLDEFLRCFSRCASCRRRGGGPLCRDCCHASVVGSTAWRARIGAHPFYFVGHYRAETGALTPLGRSLLAFKDYGDRYRGRQLATLFARNLVDAARSCDLVVPVPSDLARLRQRGFATATCLARVLARVCRLPIASDALRRVPGRPPQRGLDGGARRRNVLGAFEPTPAARATFDGRSVALCDDVMTTGATLASAAACLVEAGASGVVCCVLACADDQTIADSAWQRRERRPG